MNYYGEQTAHEQLTDLLMNNGCTVNKLAIDELVRWIAIRDEDTLHKVIKDAEITLSRLQSHTRLNDLVATDKEAK